MTERTTIERALELADSGSCRSMTDIRRKLRDERFENIDAHLGGATLKRQLMTKLKARSPS